MKNDSILTSPIQLAKIKELLEAFLLLPFFDGIPGKVLELILSHVHDGRVLGTYDFIDIVNDKERIGWQVKSTKKSTPITWKRAKIPAKAELIEQSKKTAAGKKVLGDAIINYCNQHVIESIKEFRLSQLIYARLIDWENGSYTYFERPLAISGILFDPNDFEWHWSTPKTATKKEQLPAFHGRHKSMDIAMFAWHGLGENQLHFKGEHTWWPNSAYPFQVTISAPKKRLAITEILEILRHDVIANRDEPPKKTM